MESGNHSSFDRAAAELLGHLMTLKCYRGWRNEPLDSLWQGMLGRASRQELLTIAAAALLGAMELEGPGESAGLTAA
jgi:hypothetical protein